MKKFILLMVLMLVCGVANATDYCADANIRACWTMSTEGGSGTTLNDDSSKNKDGTFSSSGHPSWYAMSEMPAYASWAVDFTSASSDKITWGSFIDGVTQSLSVTSWINPDSYDGTIIGSASFASGQGFQFYVNASGYVSFRLIRNGAYYQQATTQSAIGYDWVHIAGAWTQADTPIMYVNGISVSKTSASGGGSSPNVLDQTTNAMGVDGSSGTNYFDGKITEASVFQDAITSTEVSDIYDHGLKGTGNRVSIASLPSVLSDSVWSHTTFN
jgi:hypothetical protein